MVNKKGAEKYYIIISLILGLMIIAISFYFIFNEYFTQEDIDWETCRQSIVLRGYAPEVEASVTEVSTKGILPLKCKTQVIEIDSSEPDEIFEIIADTVATCWFLYGEGKLNFMDREQISSKNFCMICARIEFSKKAQEEFDEKTKNKDSNEMLELYNEYSVKKFEEYYKENKISGLNKIYDEFLPLFPLSNKKEKYYFEHSFIKNYAPRGIDLFIIYSKYNFRGVGSGGVSSWIRDVLEGSGVTTPLNNLLKQSGVDSVEVLTNEKLREVEIARMGIYDNPESGFCNSYETIPV